MGRLRDPNRDKAQEIYKTSKGKIALIEIANQLGVPEGTVRGWKAKDKWDESLKGKNGTLQKKERNAPKNMERSETVKEEKQSDPPIEYEEPENDELNEKQRLFCIYYVKSFNQTMSAIKAGYAKDRAHITGSELVRNSKVRAEIARLKGKVVGTLMVDVMDVLNKYAEIAFADITDYVEFGEKDELAVGEEGEPIINPATGEPMTFKRNFVSFKNSSEIDGTLISEVKQGKDGVSVKLHDKMKALEKLEQYFDILPDKHKRMVEEEKLKLEREKLEIARTKASDEDADDEEGDGLESLAKAIAESKKLLGGDD